MSRKVIYKHITYLLLLAMMFASVPVHQLFHKHRNIVDLETGNHIKKYEKSCCKAFEGLTGDIALQLIQLKTEPSFGVFLLSDSAGHFTASFFHFSNKAPPVTLA